MTLTHKDTGTVTGDAAKGKTVYDASGCAGCHIISGEGSDGAGPELTEGRTTARGRLLEDRSDFILGSDLPQARVFESGGLLDYLHIHLVTRGGRRTTARAWWRTPSAS